jgi:hypothetical protein
MDKNNIFENNVKEILLQVLSEETSKVKREEFNRLQFKMDELQNSLNETIKEMRKMEDSIPNGLKTICNGRVNSMSTNLLNVQKLLTQLKEKVKQHKKTTYTTQIEQKKK